MRAVPSDRASDRADRAPSRASDRADHASGRGPGRLDRSPGRARRAFGRIAILIACCALALVGFATAAPVASADTTFTFSGGGWGHGVGMSQWGARGMAEQGNSAPQILGHYYQGTATTTAATGTIRVLLGTAASFTFTPSGAATYSPLFSAPVGTSASPVVAAASGGTVVLSGGVNAAVGAPVVVGFNGAPVRMTPPGYRYNRGTLVLLPTGTGTIQAVLQIPMQEYLYGLGEMPSSWPMAALQSQAIAARTYAQKKVNTVGGTGTYDIVGGLPDQSYLAYDKEGAAMGSTWVQAVDSTNGQVVTYGGALIDAVYSASSGGHTENSETVWVSAVPYLRGVSDPADLTGGNPNASWTRSYSGAQLGAWFGVGQVTSVQILGTVGVSGRVDKATIRLTGTGGTRDVTGAAFRSTVNASSPSAQLMSTKFTVGGAATPPPVGNSAPGGIFGIARADGSTVVVGGAAGDPDGDPRVRIVSTMGAQVATREVQSAGGLWSASWTGSKGTRNICVWVLDTPTGQPTSLGCRDVTVK